MSTDLQGQGIAGSGFMPRNNHRDYRARRARRWPIAALAAPAWIALLLLASRLDSWYPAFVVGAFSVAFYLVEIFAERNQASTAFSTEMERVRADIRRRLQYYENTAFSKRYLEARLDEEVKRSRRYRLPLTLLLLTVGVRPQGKDWDDIAAAVISTSSKVLRSEDVLGYLGESHFALILPHTARNQAGVVAGRLAAGLRDCDPTFGLAEIDDHATTGQDLVKSAQADLEAAFLGHLKCTLWNEAAQLD